MKATNTTSDSPFDRIDSGGGCHHLTVMSESKDEHFRFRLSASLKRDLEELRHLTGESQSVIVRNAIREYSAKLRGEYRHLTLPGLRVAETPADEYESERSESNGTADPDTETAPE